MRQITMLFFLLGMLFKVSAQETYSGIVSDAYGVLEGANILIKHTNKGVASNSKGYFELKANLDDTLQVSYLGYDIKEIVLTNKKHLKLMMEGSEVLDEVTVVGYGSYSCREVICCGIVSIKIRPNIETKIDNNILYPNTSPNGLFNLKLSKVHKRVKVYVSNMSGQTVKEMTFINLKTSLLHLNLSQFSSGIYLFNIVADGKKIAVKKGLIR